MTSDVLPEEQRRRILEQIYPGWRIVYLSHLGHWYARRTATPDARLQAAGVHVSFIRTSYEEFLTALNQQDGIIHVHGGAHY